MTLSVVGGGIFFHEFEQCFQGFTAFMFVVGLLTIFFGVFLLSPQPTDMPSEEFMEPSGEPSNRSPLLHRDSFFASGGGMGMSLPTPTLVQAVSLRSAVSPFSSGGSVSSVDQVNEQASAPGTPSMNFGIATFPIVDALDAREQRASSGASGPERARSGSGRALTT